MHEFTAVASSSTSNCFGCDWASFSSHVACHAYLHPCESSWTLRLHGLDVARPVSSDHKAPAHCITDNLQTRRRQSRVYLQGVCYAKVFYTESEKKTSSFSSSVLFMKPVKHLSFLTPVTLTPAPTPSTIIFETCSH